MSTGFEIRKIILSAFICLVSAVGAPAHAQNRKSDSLLALIRKDKADTNKINHLNDLSWELKNSNPDTSIVLGTQALGLANTCSWKKGIAASLGNIGVAYYLKTDFPKALDNYVKALKINEEINNKKGISSILGNMGVVYQNQGDYPKALDYYFKALKVDEELGNKSGISRQFGNMANVYFFQEDYPKALDNYFKALKIGEELGDKGKIAIQLGNLGNVYHQLGLRITQSSRTGQKDSLYGKSLDYYFRALKIDEEIGSKNGMAIRLGNIGSLYCDLAALPFTTPQEKKEYQTKGLGYFLRTLKMREELGAKDLIASSILNIGSLYFSLKQYKQSFDYLYRALGIFHKAGEMDYEKQVYHTISLLYEVSDVPLADTIGGKMQNMEQMRLRSMYYYKRYISIRDTLFSEENKKELVRKEMNFEFEKKAEITKAENLRNEEIAAAESKKQKIVIVSIACSLLLVGGFAVFILRALRITRKQKILIEHQKHLVDEKQKEILDSIYYARRIQRALITNENYIIKNLKRLRNP